MISCARPIKQGFFPFLSFLLAWTLILLPGEIHAQFKIVGYIPNELVHPIEYKKITHLNLAFENPDSLGVLSFSVNNTKYIQDAHAGGVKVLVSLGGGGASFDPKMQQRYFGLIKDENRARFVRHILEYILEHDFDGVDVDLEGPAINDDYGKFIFDLHTLLKGSNKLLTAALTHMNGADRVEDQTIKLFDYISIMAYDATGPWRPERPGQHASLQFARESLNYWMKRGLAREKAILGVPFYGYGFGKDFNEGVSYSQIINRYPQSENRDSVGATIYYNGLTTITSKAQLTKNGKYGGIMIWQLAQDTVGTKSLLNAINKILNSKSRK